MYLLIGENYGNLDNLELYDITNQFIPEKYKIFFKDNKIYVNIDDIKNKDERNIIDYIIDYKVYGLINYKQNNILKLTKEYINIIEKYYNTKIDNINNLVSTKYFLYNNINNIINKNDEGYYIDYNNFKLHSTGEIEETTYNIIENIRNNNKKRNLEINEININKKYSLYPKQFNIFKNKTIIDIKDKIKILKQKQYKGEENYLDDFCTRNETLENTFGLIEEKFNKEKNDFTLLNWDIHYFINSCNIFKHTNGKIEYKTNDKDNEIININKIKEIINKYECDYINLQKYNIIEYEEDNKKNISNFWDLEGLEKYNYDYQINNMENKFNISIGVNKDLKSRFIKGNFNNQPYIISKTIINNKELYIINIYLNNTKEKMINIYLNNTKEKIINILKPLIYFLKRLNENKKNFIITGGYNINYDIIEEIFKQSKLYLTNLNRLMIPYFEKYHTTYKKLSINDYILCSDHFFYDFIPKEIKILNVNYSDHLPIIFKFSIRNNTNNYLDFGDINNYISKIYPKLYNSIKTLINVYYKDFNKEEYLESFEEVNIGYIYYNLKQFFKSYNLNVNNSITKKNIKINKELFKKIKIPEETYLTHSITFWNMPGNDTYTIKERLCEEKLDNNYNINKPIELEDGGLNKYFLGASFNFILDATEAFSPFYNNGIEGRTYLLKILQDLNTINLYSNSDNNDLRAKFYDIFLKNFKNYYKNNKLKIIKEDKDKNTSVGLLANMLQLFILPFYILTDTNDKKYWSSEIFYGMIITDFMPSIVPIHLTENKLIYNTKNQFSNCEIYIPYARKFVEITHIYADFNIYSIDEWKNEYKNYFIKKFNELYDIIKYKEDQFGYNKKFLTNMYYVERHSARFFMNIYNSILNHIIFNLKIYNYDIFTKNYDIINSILNHINSLSSFYYSYSIQNKIIFLINHLLNNFFYLKENILSNVINKEYYRRYLNYPFTLNNKYLDNYKHSAFIPDIFNHRQLNNIFKLLLIDKDFTNYNLEQILNILNNFSLNNINIKIIYNHINNNINTVSINNLLHYLDLVENPFITLFENPLIIIYDIYKLQYDNNVITQKNNIIYDEIIKTITKKLNYNNDFIYNYNKYLTTYLNNTDFKNIYPSLYNYISKYKVINDFIVNNYNINNDFNNDCIYIIKPLDKSNNIIMNNIKFNLNDEERKKLFKHYNLLRKILFNNNKTIKEMYKINRKNYNEYNKEYLSTGFNKFCDIGFINLNDFDYNIYSSSLVFL